MGCVCVRAQLGLSPTGKLCRLAWSMGFSNAHDFLVHRETGEARAPKAPDYALQLIDAPTRVRRPEGTAACASHYRD